MISFNAPKLPPGHPNGLNVSDDVIEKTADVLYSKYLFHGVPVDKEVGFRSFKSDRGEVIERQGSDHRVISKAEIVKALRYGHQCFGASHDIFPDLFVVSVEDTESDDQSTIQKSLNDLGWEYKCFSNGPGWIFWVFFEPLPLELKFRFCSEVAAMKAIRDTFLQSASKSLLDLKLLSDYGS